MSTPSVLVEAQSPGVEASWLGRFYRQHEQLLIGAAASLAFLLAWESAVRSGLVNPLFISAPTRIARAAYRLVSEGDLWRHLRVSATEFLAGYLMAIGLAIPLGLAVGWYRRLYFCLAPFIDALNAVPRVALLPLLVIWFGIGIWSKIVVVFLGAVIPLLINTFSGVKITEARFLRVARSFGASEFRIFRTIVLPGTVPFVFTGLKYAAGRALLGVVVGELYAATAGIGYLITVAGSSFQTDTVFVGILTITCAGVLTVELLNRLERRFDRWRPPASSAP
ncbi:MAG: ABC transporter permease [Candidatus Rokubacteria bacterium]|nr:ABC transporter permease [Candidatus Rokubacteria bacterium]